jgi:hypothetical protein
MKTPKYDHISQIPPELLSQVFADGIDQIYLKDYEETRVMNDEKYVFVTAISTHRIRYCIPVSELQAMNTDVPIDGHEIEWAEDCVTMNEAEEFSQFHLGEMIVDSEIKTEEEMLAQFDKDNSYLRSWSTEQKIEYANKWKFLR